MNDITAKNLALSHMWVAFIAFILACFMGEYQVLERSGLIEALYSPTVYFASVSTHGVLMGFVLTTFFITKIKLLSITLPRLSPQVLLVLRLYQQL